MNRLFRTLSIVSVSLLTSAAWAATPPALLNYQGVLRDSTDKPLSGTYDMTFTFWDAATAGNQILIDQHLAGSALGVTASGGLFNTALGGGTVSDGSGPGLYRSLADVFRDFDTVYLQVQIGAETLNPRTRILAAAYAQNATLAQDALQLGGQTSSSYLDTFSGFQSKSGRLSLSWTGVIGTDTLFAQNLSAGLGNNAVRAEGVNGLRGDLAHHSGGSSDWGVYGVASGSGAGGRFEHGSGSSSATLGGDAIAVNAVSTGEGGRFESTYGGVGHVGYGSVGVRGSGPSTGGEFVSSVTPSLAYLGWGGYGISAVGSYTDGGSGGVFQDSFYSGIAYLAHGNTGIDAYGTYAGGIFRYGSPWGYTTEALMAYGSASIQGNGSKNFVQNHPYDPQRVIVYSAPEGDEVATYTRGSARLVDGVARVALGPTFRWVTNPEIGLTAHLTPHGQWAELYVESLSTEELVVRSRDARPGDIAFDYMVYGLRIGFERSAVVQEKLDSAPIPSMAFHEAQYARHPELADYAPLARFTAQNQTLGRAVPTSAGRAAALLTALGQIDAADAQKRSARVVAPGDEIVAPTPSPSTQSVHRLALDALRRPKLDAVAPATPITAGATALLVQQIEVAGTVETGDLVAVDGVGSISRTSIAADPLVYGVVGGERGSRYDGTAPIALAGTMTLCHVEATQTPIAVGDLLVSSTLPGQAMKAGADARPGTIVAKALEPLAGGSGLIRVLVMSR